MLSKQTIPNASLEDAIQEESVQTLDGQGSSALYKDVDIYQILVADLVIHHKEILQNIPLEIAIQTMKSAWKLSHSTDEGFKG
ncbi:hypothetical protein [Acaryochloris marina]|uniref:Uncharacterized protein n=1 Tax=Acaryochloris marina (strain MBIC 11017) TaxID=329726 RepID=A8ZP78_ACAM1|nr:hypothetical protein [Acaryochloris marina]ABW32814.1 hypothetical protein AM1_E0044 [Acaryochloris marina MBIC11017]